MLVVVFFLGFNFYQDSVRQKEVQMINSIVVETEQNTTATLNEIEFEIDSLHKHIGKLATATVYLDSCQQQKVVKAERAERRGRFVGGLLKGLLPF